MSFQDELKHVLNTARDERARYEQEGLDFESRWLSLREALVWAVFHEAKAVLVEEKIAADPLLTNSSIVLRAVLAAIGRRPDNFLYTLTFRPDKEALLIVCSSNLTEIKEESFTLDHLTISVVQNKVKLFVETFARGKTTRREVAP